MSAAPSKKREFGWEWMKWFQENHPSIITLSEMDKLQTLFYAREAFAQAATRPTSKINWDEWRAKIKDPAFVEELRAKYCAEFDISNSRTTPDQELKWSEPALKEKLKEYSEEVSKSGLAWSTDDVWLKDIFCNGMKDTAPKFHEWGKNCDETFVDMRRSLHLDYEQAEAERDLFGYRGEMMNLAEHPEIAEQTEESLAGKQTYSDKLLFEHEFHRFHKRERLAQCQDDKERERFLANYKHTIRIHGHEGMEAT